MEQENTRHQLCEDIEWLKIIEMGYLIKSHLAPSFHERGVNTQEDYDFLLNKYDE